jgi:glycosyltransferase involved in cell wall biosynthesis
LVKNNHLGLHCAPGEPDLLAQTIRQCIALPEEERREMGMRGRRLFEQHFDKNILIGRYVEMFERLALGHT